MLTKLQIGLSRKIGRPDYGSVGAHCSVELELDADILVEPDALRHHARRAYAACHAAVEEQLARETSSSADSHDATGGSVNGHARNGHASNGHTAASTKQMDYIATLTRAMSGMTSRRLEELCLTYFNQPLAALTSHQASQLIDRLKTLRAARKQEA